MNYVLIAGLLIVLVAMVVGFRLGWELLQQNGRMLLRMEALEKRLGEKAESRKPEAETDQNSESQGGARHSVRAEAGDHHNKTAQGTDEPDPDDRANRFG